MLSKKEKSKIVEDSKKRLKESRYLIFGDFGGVGVEGLRSLRRALREKESFMKIIKKRLLGIVLKDSGYDFDPGRFKSQAGTVFSKSDLNEAASPMAKFAKENKNFKILGAYDLENRLFISAEETKAIGSLPSKEALIGQTVVALAGIIKSFLFVLNERAKKSTS